MSNSEQFDIVRSNAGLAGENLPKDEVEAILKTLKNLVEEYIILCDEGTPESIKKQKIMDIFEVAKKLFDKDAESSLKSGKLADNDKVRVQRLILFSVSVGNGNETSETEKAFFEEEGWQSVAVTGETVDDSVPPVNPPPPPPPATPEPEDGENEPADSWIASKKEEIQDIILEIETQLELEDIVKGQKHSKDKFIESEFNNGVKGIIKDSEKRRKKFPADDAKYIAFKTYIFDERRKFFTDWNVAIDENEEALNVSKMTLRELADYILRKELTFWDGEHERWTDENDRKVVDALVQRLWKDKHKVSGLTKDEIPEEPGHFYADLDIREVVSDLQILGLFGLMNEKGSNRTDDGVAEGRITELENRMSELQFSKERLNETTFAHPRYGLILYEVMRRMKDQPTLKKGETPILKQGMLPAGYGRLAVNDRVVQRGSEKIVLLGDRFEDIYDDVGNVVDQKVLEYTPTEAGDVILFDYASTVNGVIRPAVSDRVVERNGMDVLLVGDRLNKIVDEKGKEIGARWYDPEQTLAGDEELYKFDPRFCYETLGSDGGKDALKEYAAYMMSLIDEQRQEEKAQKEALAAGIVRVLDKTKIHFKELIGKDLPDPGDKLGKGDIDRLQMYARYLFFSFPFLTNILAVRQERTQTPSHGKGNKDGIPYISIFDMAGFISHKSQRYANSDTAYYYMLKFFKPFKEGHYGAGGEARRLNLARDLVIKYDKVYGDGEENFGAIPEMPYGSSIFHTALSMVALAEGDTSMLMGKAKLYDGSIIDASPDNPKYLALGGNIVPKRKDPFNYGLLFTSIKAWDALFTRVVEDLPSGLSIEHIAEGGGKDKSLISSTYGDNIGQIKMSSARTKEKARRPNLKEYSHLKITANALWDFVKRIFVEYQATSVDARVKLYEEIEKGFKHTAEVGGLSTGDAAYVLQWVLEQMSKPDSSGRLYGKGINGFKGMNPCLAPQEATVTGPRGKEVFDYVEALWNYKHSDADGHVTRPFPFKLMPGSNVLGRLTFNKSIVRQVVNPDPEIKAYEAMLYGKAVDPKSGKFVPSKLPAPFERVHLEKHDD